ncbi:MAG: selenium metabolism-associated LysR family transcriptional regulator [Oscillospiraceae bacterium]
MKVVYNSSSFEKRVLFMEFTRLKTFIEVFEEKNFSKVAEKLYLSQPTVSCQIQKLEQDYGTIFFSRNGKSIEPTADGMVFYKYAKEMINMHQNLLYELGTNKELLAGVIRLGSSSVPQIYILPKIIKEFCMENPNINFEMTTTDSENVIKQIIDGYISLGIVGAKVQSKHIEYIELMKDRLVLALPKSYKDKYKPYDKISIDDFRKIPLILREGGSGTRIFLEEFLNGNNITIDTLNIRVKTTLNNTVINLIKEDVGGSIISDIAIKDEIESGEIIPIEIDGLEMIRSFYFAIHKSRVLSPICEEFKNYIMENYSMNKGM